MSLYNSLLYDVIYMVLFTSLFGILQEDSSDLAAIYSKLNVYLF